MTFSTAKSNADSPPALDTERAAQMLAALGSLPRLAVFRCLLRAGSAGLTVSALQAEVNMPASTLNHHLSALVAVGVVQQHRLGREVFCEARYQDIRRLSHFLTRECCADAHTDAPAPMANAAAAAQPN